MRRFLAVLGICFVGGSLPANSASILLYDDFIFANNTYQTAGLNLGHTVTFVTNDTDFVTGLSSGSYDLAIFSENNTNHPVAQSALASYVASGGLAIYDTWISASAAISAFDAAYDGTANHSSLTVSNPSLLTGLSSATLALSNPTFGIFSLGYVVAPGGEVAGTFNNGSVGIVLGNDDRTFLNGNLSETFASLADEIQLYENEISFLLADPIPASEPATLALLGMGLLGIGWARRRTRAP